MAQLTIYLPEPTIRRARRAMRQRLVAHPRGSIALSRDATLVTRNVSELRRIVGLKLERW